MTSILSEISDFGHFLNIVISDLWVNCKSQNNIQKCFFVDLNYLWKFEVESKFYQKLKILITKELAKAKLAKFQILTTFWTLSFLTCEWIASIKMTFKSVFSFIWTICGSLRLSRILSKIENFHDRGPERNFRFWPLFDHCHFWLVSQFQVSK